MDPISKKVTEVPGNTASFPHPNMIQKGIGHANGRQMLNASFALLFTSI
jgi:hypothetical protein